MLCVFYMIECAGHLARAFHLWRQPPLYLAINVERSDLFYSLVCHGNFVHHGRGVNRIPEENEYFDEIGTGYFLFFVLFNNVITQREQVWLGEIICCRFQNKDVIVSIVLETLPIILIKWNSPLRDRP